jgi:hypothetical protein
MPCRRTLFSIIPLLVLLLGCRPIQATIDPEATPIPFIFKITKVVDKLTGEPITTNYLMVTVKKGEKDTVNYEATNIEGYRIEIPVDTEAHVVVEAPGYHRWELVFRPKASKYMEGPVELVPIDSSDEINGI